MAQIPRVTTQSNKYSVSPAPYNGRAFDPWAKLSVSPAAATVVHRYDPSRRMPALFILSFIIDRVDEEGGIVHGRVQTFPGLITKDADAKRKDRWKNIIRGLSRVFDELPPVVGDVIRVYGYAADQDLQGGRVPVECELDLGRARRLALKAAEHFDDHQKDLRFIGARKAWWRYTDPPRLEEYLQNKQAWINWDEHKVPAPSEALVVDPAAALALRQRIADKLAIPVRSFYAVEFANNEERAQELKERGKDPGAQTRVGS